MKKNTIFVIKKIITLTEIYKINNRKKDNFRNKTKNFKEIKTLRTYFWPIT